MDHPNVSREKAERLRAPTVQADGKRRWLYPERLGGKRATFRRRLALILMVFYLLAPFLKVNGNPMFRIDFGSHKAYFFGVVFAFHEAFYFVFVLMILALALFLFTSIKGRIWCGYACPQTVFVDWLVRPIEELIEGKANHRRANDLSSWTGKKIFKKIVKHSIFVILLLVISNAFLAYFVAPEQLLHWMTSSPVEHPFAFSVMLFVFGALYFDLVWFREQFCAFLCPYARFQTLMFDERTPVISYDAGRGEPRGKRGQVGDCINCELCVRVCPTGIDIRDGLQLECIQCGRCADACDMIMTNLKRPNGLIRHCSEAELLGKKINNQRIRPWIYCFLLALITITFTYQILGRKDLDVRVLRQTGTTFTVFDDGSFANYFQIKVTNRTSGERSLDLIDVPIGIRIICGVCQQKIRAKDDVSGQLIVIDSRRDREGRIVLGFSHEFKVELDLLRP